MRLRLRVKGTPSVTPTPIAEQTSSEAGLNPLRNGLSPSGGNGYTNYIPASGTTSNRGGYTPPPKRTPFVVIPEGVCSNC